MSTATARRTAAPKRSRRTRRPYETHEFAAFARRTLRAWIARAADGDPEDLAELLAAAAQLDTGIRAAVHAQRATYGTSWTVIGSAAGITRQAAQQRWGQ